MSEKYIKELREHLFEIYKYRRNDRTLTYNMSIELLSRTCTTLDYLQQEIEILKQRIDKAIEYMENTTYEKSENECGYTSEWDIRELYDILKGSDSNG